LVEILYEDVVPRLKVQDVYEGVRFVSTGPRFMRSPCPLHGGQDPNFSVNVTTLSWTCFSHCGHGSVVSYLNGGEPAKGDRFREIVANLASRAGVEIAWSSTPGSPEVVARFRRRELLEGFAVLGQRELNGPGAVPAVGYLASRGFPPDARILSEMGLGYLPATVNLLDALKATASELSENGLSDPRWRSRVIIPWRDKDGHVATFLGRDVLGVAQPRYIYLRAAPIPPLFGLERLRAGKADTLLIVESPLDAVLLWHRGIDHALAIGGALLTTKHLRALHELRTRTVILALDNDAPGRAATNRFLELAGPDFPDIRVHVIPGDRYELAKDVGEYLAQHDETALRDLIDARLPAAAYRANVAVSGIGPASPLGQRRDALDRVSHLARSLDGPDRLADLEDVVSVAVPALGYSEAVIREVLGGPGSRSVEPAPRASERSSTAQTLLEAVYGGPLPDGAVIADDDEVWEIVDALPVRLSKVLSLRYERYGSPVTLEDAAEALAGPLGPRLSRERIRQLQLKGLQRLRHPSRMSRLLGDLRPLPRRDTPSMPHRPPVSQATSRTDKHPATGSAQSSAIEDLEGLADQLVETLLGLSAAPSMTMLTHVMRGVRARTPNAAVNEAHRRVADVLRNLPFGSAQRAIESACRSDSRIVVGIVVSVIVGAPRKRPRPEPIRHDVPRVPGRQGLAWAEADRARLLDGWAQGLSVGQLAEALDRSPGGVAGALVRFGVVESRDHARARDDLPTGKA
jgi:DNA primase catalytic core